MINIKNKHFRFRVIEWDGFTSEQRKKVIYGREKQKIRRNKRQDEKERKTSTNL